jgi:hypothetical protein
MLAAAMLATGAANVPGPAPAQPLWQGNLFVTSLSPACSGSPAIGTFFLSVYRQNLPPPPFGAIKVALSLIAPNYAILLGAKGDTLRGAADVLDTVIYPNSEFLVASEKTDLAIAPAKTSKKTPSVLISGTLHNLFITDAGCDVGVTGVLGLRPGG